MSEIVLPTKTRTAITKSPKKLVIYSSPKVGKSTLMSGLNSSLLIDLEDGSDSVDNIMVLKAKTYQEIYNICEKVKVAGRPYRYIALDTATALEEMVMPLAKKLYQQTPMGKSFNDGILTLPNGAGYLYVRQAYMMVLSMVEEAAERTILFGHIKDKVIDKAGKEVAAKDIDLTGKLRTIVCANADAIGFLYRDGNRNIITFETSDEIVCGARPTHLRNRAFPLSELMTDGTIRTYWDMLYID
jgi:hypothetical protein